MAATNLLRCRQCVCDFSTVPELTQHSCAQQQQLQASTAERLEAAAQEGTWVGQQQQQQDGGGGVDTTLMNIVQNDLQQQATSRSDVVVSISDSSMVMDRAQSAFHASDMGLVQNNAMGGRNSATAYSHWSREATLMLIKLFRENEASFSLGNRKKRLVWQDITDTLRQHGHQFTRYQVEGRWKTLTAAYRRTVQHNLTSLDQRDWPFFKELSEIFTVRRLTSYALEGSCNGYAAGGSRRKSKQSNQLDVIEWLCKYEQRHEQRTQGFFDRIERMHREKLNALRELVEIMRKLKR